MINSNRIYGDSLDSGSDSDFWRILGDGPFTGLITSERKIQRFDTRVSLLKKFDMIAHPLIGLID